MKIDDIVLVHDEHLHRTLWKLRKVAKTFVGRDGKLRPCEVETNNSLIKKTINFLYNFELKDIKN